MEESGCGVGAFAVLERGTWELRVGRWEVGGGRWEVVVES
jgi:hypothetical protein